MKQKIINIIKKIFIFLFDNKIADVEDRIWGVWEKNERNKK